MAEDLIEDDDQLIELRNALITATDQLLEERSVAIAAGDTAKIEAAEAEFDGIGVILATVQGVISRREAIRLNAVAARLEQSIAAQRAVGLSGARRTLEDLLGRLRRPGGLGGGGEQPGGGGEPPGDAQPPSSTGSLRARPGKHESVVNQLIAGAQAQGLDPMTVLTIVAIESDFDPTAASPLSSAGGLFQFIDTTWVKAGGKKIGTGGAGNGFASKAPVDVQVSIGCKFIADSISELASKLGKSPTVTQLYIAHQQGLSGGLKILRAAPGSPIESVIGDKAARNNRLDGLTVAQAIAKFEAMVRSNADEARAVVMTAQASAGGGTTGGGTPSPSGNAIGQRAPIVALSEMEKFARRNGTILRETEQPLGRRVLEYFSLVGRPDIVDPSAEPWSAAFISHVMRNAGAGPTQFPISQNHAKYILVGLANRMNNRLDASVVYFDRDEMAPRVGDLIGFSRTASVKSRADMEPFLPDKFFPSHTDLVIDVSPGKIKVIGGNVSQTILTKSVRSDPEGKISPSEQHFFVLRVNV